MQLVLDLLHASKTNDYDLYCFCLYEMTDLFFSFDQQNYAWYLSFFANIDHAHPEASDLLREGAIRVARSFIPGSQSPVDKTIGETLMHHCKSQGGIGGGTMGISGLHIRDGSKLLMKGQNMFQPH